MIHVSRLLTPLVAILLITPTLQAEEFPPQNSVNEVYGIELLSNFVPAPAPAYSPSSNYPRVADVGGADPTIVVGTDDAVVAPPSDQLGAELEELRARLSEMEGAWQDHMDDLDKAKKKAASKPTFQMNGRIHADYWAFPEHSDGIGFFEHPAALDPQFGTDPEDFFAFRRIRLEMKGDILETGYWRIQIDFNNPSSGEMKDVFIGFKELPGNHRIQVGNQKRPLGLDHLNSSRYNVFLERPFVVESFNEDARRPGITLYGNNCDESLGWASGVYLLENISTDGRYRGDNYQASWNGRLHGSPWYDEASGGRGYYHCAISGMYAHTDGDSTALSTNANEGRFRTRPLARTASRWYNTGRIAGATDYGILGFESMFNAGPFQLTSEYQANWLDRAGATPGAFFHGGYVFAAYNITGEHIPYSRKSGTIGRLVPFENFFLVDTCRGCRGRGMGAFQVGARYDFIDLTDNGINGGVGHAGTLALNWFFTPYSKLQFNAIYGNIQDRGPIGGFTDGHYVIVGTRLAIEF